VRVRPVTSSVWTSRSIFFFSLSGVSANPLKYRNATRPARITARRRV
jgi:hypothetical protein